MKIQETKYKLNPKKQGFSLSQSYLLYIIKINENMFNIKTLSQYVKRDYNSVYGMLNRLQEQGFITFDKRPIYRILSIDYSKFLRYEYYISLSKTYKAYLKDPIPRYFTQEAREKYDIMSYYLDIKFEDLEFKEKVVKQLEKYSKVFRYLKRAKSRYDLNKRFEKVDLDLIAVKP